MVKVTKGQLYFNFATDLEKLLSSGPGKLDILGEGYGGFPRWHHLAAMMVVACLSSLEETLGSISWHTHNYKTDEFDALRCIRNAYVHTGSDLSKVRDAGCFSIVQNFHKQLMSGNVTGQKGNVIEAYFDLNGTVVQLKQSAIRRMRSLYIGLLIHAGIIVQ